MKQRYKVVLPIDIDGRIYQHGEEIELDLKTATDYAHALRAVDAVTTEAAPIEKEHTDGGNS